MSRNWTPAQKKAIESKGSVLVSASAGTGKTAVLTEKIKRLIIEENVDITNILVMTFSNAAAEEMKERIKSSLESELENENNNAVLKTRIWSQLKLFPESNIQTIHSFCNNIVKKYFYKMGLDANIKIADDIVAAILRRKAVDEVLKEEFSKSEKSFVDFENMLEGLETVEETIINSYNKIISFIDTFEWLDNSIEAYNLNTKQLPDFIKSILLSDFEKAYEFYRTAYQKCEFFSDDMTKVKSNLQGDMEIISSLIENLKKGNYEEIQSGIFASFAPTLRFPTKTDSDFDEVKKFRAKGKDLITKKYKNTNFNLKEQIFQTKEMYPILKKYQDILIRVHKEYTSLKNAKRIIDFNDMEKYAYEILKDNNIAYEYQRSFVKIFVDEYQDTSPIQEAIIRNISTENNVFCVGDIKQSIYRFRSSDPTLFSQRSKDYTSGFAPGTVISLNHNFRSSQNILNCANDVFKNITQSSKEIDYTKNDELTHGRIDKNIKDAVVVSLINDSLKEEFPEMKNDELEAYNLARIISENVGGPIFDPHTQEIRPAEYKDIVILCRKLSGISDYISKVFTEKEIPFVIEKSGKLLETFEVQILLNIIEIINNSKNDIKLLSIMHLGLFDFTDEDIITLRVENKGSSFYDTIHNLKTTENQIGEKCFKLFSFIKDCKKREKYMSLTELIEYIISKLNLKDLFAVMNNGQQRLANINEIVKHASNFEFSSSEKLYGFMNYIKDIERSGKTLEEAKTNLAPNSVRIMTIHKSKGLEFPIVLLAYTGKKFNTLDKKTNIVISRESGIGVKYFNSVKNEKGKTIIRSYVEDCVTEKNMEEEMRLLYVAMTRAQEKLFIQGVTSSSMQISDNNETNNMLNWILSTLANNNTTKEINGVITNEVSLILDGEWDIETVSSENILSICSEKIESELIEKKTSQLPILIESNLQSIDFVPLFKSASLIEKRKNMEFKKEDFIIPSFASEDINQGAKIGTITHDFLQFLDFKNTSTLEDIKTQSLQMIQNGLLSEDDVENIDFIKIYNFLDSSLGKEIIQADEYIKEKSINIIKKSNEVNELGNYDILIRCVLDLIYKKGDKYYLVDYKTDKIKENESLKVHSERHLSQLKLYQIAAKTIYNIEFEGIYLVYLSVGEWLKLEL